MPDVIRKSLKVSFTDTLVDELLEAYEEAKRRFYRDDLGPSAVFGGRFCEAAFRILQEAVDGTGSFTPVGSNLGGIDPLMGRLASNRASSPMFSETWQQDSIGLHIPRVLRIIYDIRNNRDAAHLADKIDPNKQDATLIVSNADWVMAELVRLSHNVTAVEAQRIVQNLVTRKVPMIQEFDGFPKLLKTGLQTDQEILALLYHRGARGAQWHELHTWLTPQKVANLQSNLRQLVEDRNLVHFHRDTGYYEITATGIEYVEEQRLVD